MSMFDGSLVDELFAPPPLTRRVFVKGVGLVSLSLLMATLGGCEDLLKAIANRPLRRRLRTGSPDVDADIATYRHAVELMKALDTTSPSDQRSWLNQATIHGTPAGFNFCEHGTEHFFDWHRAYLLYFERICQKLTGNAKFGLPYWNWNQDPAIHPAYLDPASALFLARANTNMSGVSAVSTAELDPIFSDTNFYTFWQQIEGTPHNTVHGAVGLTMGGGASARDPIFWNHHCMIDYCWAKWNIELNNDTTNDTSWVSHVNSHFVDADGVPATVTAGLTTIMPLLSYRYESSAIGSSPAVDMTKRDYRKLEARLRKGAAVRFDVKQRARLAEKTTASVARPLSIQTKLAPESISRIINADPAAERVFLSVEYAELPPSRDYVVRVFLNLPNANAQTPTSDAHYAGSFAFFGSDPTPAAQVHPSQLSYLVNLSAALLRLKTRQELGGTTPLTVQLVPAPLGQTFQQPTATLVLNHVDLITTPVIVNPPPQ
jgi:tyrosinase